MRRGFLAAARPGPPPPPPPDESKCFVCGGRRSASDANADVRCFGAPACGSCARRWRVEAALRTCCDAQRLATRGRLAPYLGRFVEQFEGIRAAAPEQLDQLLDALRRNKAVGRRRPEADVAGRAAAGPGGRRDAAAARGAADLRRPGRRGAAALGADNARGPRALRGLRDARDAPGGAGGPRAARELDLRERGRGEGRRGAGLGTGGRARRGVRGPDGAVAPRAHVPRGDALRRAVGGGLARVRLARHPHLRRAGGDAAARAAAHFAGLRQTRRPALPPATACCVPRLRRELKVLTEEPVAGLSALPREKDIRVWLATVDGPADTMYAGGRFRLSLQFADDYPLQPPRVRFLTQVFHPNVDVASGAVCVDLLTDAHWTPAANVRVVLLSLQSLLADPTAVDAESPANAEAAALLKNDRPAFERRARMDAANSLDFYDGARPEDEAPEELEAPDAGEEGSPAKWASEAAAWAAREAGVEAPPPADDGEDWAPRSSPLGKSLSKAAREAAMEIG